MPIEYVGGLTSGFFGTPSAQTVALAGLTGGIASAPAAGDLVVVSYAVGSTVDRALTIDTPGGGAAYTLMGTELTASDTFDANLRVAYKFMGATPDTQVTLSGTGSTADAGRYTIQVFRGVDQTTPMDVAVTTATAINSRVANPPSIQPVTAGAWIGAVGCAACASGGTYTSSDLTDFLAGFTSDNNDAQIGAGIKINWVSGAFDPAAFGGGGTSSSNDSWCALSYALRPAADADVTGSATPSEVADTASATGTVTVVGTAAPVEAADTGAASGLVIVAGNASPVEADDTAAASGDVAASNVTGSAAVTEADDVSAAAGVVLVAGSAAAEEAADTAIASGLVIVTGAAAPTEANDTASAAGLVLENVTGSAAAIEQDDAASASGFVAQHVTGAGAATEEDDVASAFGTAGAQASPNVNDVSWRKLTGEYPKRQPRREPEHASELQFPAPPAPPIAPPAARPQLLVVVEGDSPHREQLLGELARPAAGRKPRRLDDDLAIALLLAA